MQVLKVVSPSSLRGCPIVCLTGRPGRDHMLLMAHNNACKLFDANSLRMVAIRNLAGAHCRNSYIQGCFSPDGSYVLTGSDDGAW